MILLRERELFELLQGSIFPNLVMSKNQFSKWDCYETNKRLRIELKCRRTHYPDLVIEKIKYDALIGKATRNNDRPLYINSTPEGIFLFDLSKFKSLKWFKKSMPMTTEFSNKRYIQKEVAMLNISDSYNITEIVLRDK